MLMLTMNPDSHQAEASQAQENRVGLARRVVVKIGSALLVDRASGRLDAPWFADLVADIARLRKRGQDVLVVSSGAIALGRRHLGLRNGVLRLEESQAAAAAGQIRLAHAWQEALAGHGIPVAQVLLTLGDTEQRRRYLNARGTLETLLSLGAVPVINENDTVATEEIRYGDNDRLAARVAQMVSADCLILLSDTNGLYTADPARVPTAELVTEVRAVTPEIEAMAGEAATDVGSGGMITKVAAGRIALSAGCHMVIASGRVRHPVQAVEQGARCTWFIASVSPARVRKQWIAGSLKPRGEIHVDDGAAAALANGKSLLPAGVLRISGSFERGDAVLIRDGRGHALAHGLSAYGSVDAARIIGLRSGEIEAVLGYRGREELVHRNDLAMVARNG
jgi:glutamate 5-kinase